MISYMRGEVVELNENQVVVEVRDIGYRLFISAREAAAMPAIGESVKLHTYFHVREDAMQLYGFLTRDDLEIFKLLINVNGIGPKAALGVLSALSADDLRFAVLADDVKAITKAPGIGTKTAQKLILELRDKLSLEEAFEKRLEANKVDMKNALLATDARGEAVQALVALGYSNADSLRAVKQVELSEGMDTEEILRSALKNIAFR